MIGVSLWIGRRAHELDRTAARRRAGALRVALLGLLPLTAFASSADTAPIHFRDAARERGLDHRPTCGDPRGSTLLDSSGAGVALLDADQDGDLDLLLLDGSTLERIARGDGEPDRLYRNDDGFWVDITTTAGLDQRGWSQGAAAGDVDADGDPDLYITRFGPDLLYGNQGDGTFADLTAAAGLGAAGWSTAAAFGDVDADGDLDLYVTRFLSIDPEHPPQPGAGGGCLWRALPVPCGPGDLDPLADLLYLNDGAGRFTLALDAGGVTAADPAPAADVRIADLDADGDADIAVANDGTANYLFLGDGSGQFVEVGLRSGVAYDETGRAGGTAALALADVNGDGLLDLLATGSGREPDNLYVNRGNGLFGHSDASAELALRTRNPRTAAASFADFDNDGDLDLLAVRGERFPHVNAQGTGTRFAQSDRLFENLGGRFEIVATTGSPLDEPAVSRDLAVGDLDNDGDLDVVVTRLREPPLLLLNLLDEQPDLRQSVLIKLVGRDAHGALVRARVAGTTWTRIARTAGGHSRDDPRVHLGLEWADAADSVRVVWPGGREELLGSVPAGAEITVRRGEGIVSRRWLGGGMR